MIGLEPTFQQWLDKMVAVSAELWRVLRDDGTYWLNCGDAYAGSHGTTTISDDVWAADRRTSRSGNARFPKGFKPKDLLMMPARLAIALQDAGWYVRSEIIWAKPNPMPESVRDRPTSSHEKIYLLTKKPRYFYDADAVRIPYKESSIQRLNQPNFDNQTGGPKDPKTGNRSHRKCLENIRKGFEKEQGGGGTGFKGHSGNYDADGKLLGSSAGRNQRNVWNIATQPYPDAHFATFPPEIPRRCISAGTSERGCCPECGNQWERVVEKENIPTRGNSTIGPGYRELTKTKESNWGDSNYSPGIQETTTTGWQPTCTHEHEPIPSTVLDIFAGSGTTLEVALSLNRKAIGIELNPEYVELMKQRIMKEASQEKLSW